MAGIVRALAAAALLVGSVVSAHAGDCADDPKTTGLSRTVAIEAVVGKQIGRLQYPKSSLLRPGEVVLTFDDGPHGHYTKQILDVLDRHCVKAIFFAVGRMALSMQATLKDVARRGHTIATHSWSHPRSLARMPLEEAKIEIEKGFVATSYALGQPIAPFFRYPGLNDSPELNAYLASRQISIWSVDVVTDDTMAGTTPDQLINRAMERVRHMHGGVVLFHDLKAVTANALDGFLSQLRAERYKIVHVVSNAGYQPDPAMVSRADFSKSSLQSRVFTGIGVEDAKSTDEAVLAPGNVDWMKTDFIDLEASSIAAKRDAATGEHEKVVVKRGVPGS